MSRFQILSLDGGGLRGMFSAALLAKLEEKHGVRIADHFDLITGTSTGGLIAIGLGLGMRPRELVKFYTDRGPRVFPRSLPGHRWLQKWVHRKYGSTALRRELQEAFGDRTLGASQKRLVIPTYDLEHDQVRIFKTPHHERLRTDWSILSWKVAMATAAAPTFLPACRDVADCRLIDGGVWANNPAVIGIAEAVSMLGRPLADVHVLTLGTTSDRVKRRSALDTGGALQWIRRGDVIDVLMRGQSCGATGLAKHLVGCKQVTRIDPLVPKALAMDRPDPTQLFSHAERVAVDAGPHVQERFFGHTAEPYTPLYPSKPDGINP